MNQKEKHFSRFVVFAIIAFLFSGNIYAQLSGTWVLHSSYTNPDGTTGTGSSELILVQNGTEIVADNVATSHNNTVGRNYGGIIEATPGSDTIAHPYRLIKLTRVDVGGGNYVGIMVGIISKDENKITGYGVDVNGVLATITMTRR